MNQVLIPTLSKILGTLAAMIAKRGLKNLLAEPPLSLAISKTAESFPEIERVDDALKTWCESKGFSDILHNFEAGDRSVVDESIVHSFIEVSEFHLDDKTTEKANEILETFFAALEQEILKSEWGPILQSRREEILHKRIFDEVKKIERVEAHLEKIERLISLHLPSDQPAKEIKPEEIAHHKRIDQIRDGLIQKGKFITAKELLLKLSDEIKALPVSSEIYFRIETNLGVCDLELDNKNQAFLHFEKALDYEPENPKAISNMGLSALLRGDPKKALELSEKALSLSPDDLTPLCVYFEALAKLGRYNNLEEKIDEKVLKDPQCLATLGMIYCDKKDFSKAEGFLRKSSAERPDNPKVLALLAQTLVIPLQMELKETMPLPWKISKEIQDKIKEAETTMTRAIEICQSYENHRLLHDVLASRAGIRMMLDDFSGASADCNRILVEDPKHEVTLRNRGLIALETGKYDEAIEYLDKLPEGKNRDEVVGPLAYAYLKVKKYDECISLVKSYWKEGETSREQIKLGLLLAEAFHISGQGTECEEIIKKIHKLNPNDPEVLAGISKVRQIQQRWNEAIDRLREALAYAQGGYKDLVTLELADLYYERGRYAEAVPFYETVVDEKTDRPVLRRYLIALYNAGDFRKAHEISSQLRGEGKPIPIVSEIEALICEYLDDLDTAHQLYVGLAEAEPENPMHLVRSAFIDFKRGNRDKSVKVLTEVLGKVQDKARVLMGIAQIFALMGKSREAFSIAYRARRIGFDDPDMHLAYVRLFLSREADVDAMLHVIKGDIDTAIWLQRDEQKCHFLLLDEEPIDRGRGELRINDPLAQKLVGCHKGDRIDLKEGPYEELSYEVVEIQSKYVFAFQETLNNFTTWFPDHPGLHKVDTKEKDFSKIFALVDDRQRLTNQVLEFYQQKNLTLGAFSKLVNSSIIEVWGGLLGRGETQLIASTGSTDEQQTSAKILKDSQAITVDLLSILTLAYLKSMELLVNRSPTIYTSQSVLDELNRVISDKDFGGQGMMLIGKEGEHYTRQEITKESLERSKEFLEEIRSFVEKNCQCVAVREALKIGKEEFERLEDLLGEDSIHAILIAKEKETPLYSDDLRLRMIAKNDHAVDGVWTQTVLIDMLEKKLITSEQYQELIIKLIQGNYTYVSVNADTLNLTLRKHRFKTTEEEVGKVFDRLAGPETTEESAIEVISNCLKCTWIGPILLEQKLAVLDLCLAVLTKNRVRHRAIKNLCSALKGKFLLLPIQLDFILRNIDVWQKSHLF